MMEEESEDKTPLLIEDINDVEEDSEITGNGQLPYNPETDKQGQKQTVRFDLPDDPDIDVDDLEEKLNFTDFLHQYVGEWGRYQWVSAISIFTMDLVDAMLALGPVFIAAIPEHRCDLKGIIPDGINCTLNQLEELLIPKETQHGLLKPSQCEYYNIKNFTLLYNTQVTESHVCPSLNLNETDISTIHCDKWTYDQTFYTSTIVSDWNLVCSKSGLISNASSVYWLGVMLGLLIGGHLSDRWGRKPTAIVGYILMMILVIATAFSPNYWVFLALRFLTPVFSTFRGIGTWIGCLEMVGDGWRITVFVIEAFAWCAGYFLMAGVAYFERRWRYLQIIILLPEIIGFLVFVLYYTESPRWLLTQNRKTEAMKHLRLIAKRNHRKVQCRIVPTVEEETETVSAIQLFRWPKIRLITFILFYLWMGMGLVYYGISMNTSNLGGNPFINFIISGAVDLVSSLVALMVINKFGRIPSFSYGLLVGGLVLISSAFVPAEKHVWILTAAMVGKFFTAIPGNVTWLYGLEVYPTSIRSIGVHMCSIMARIGAIGASYLGILTNINRALPLLVFGISALIGGCLAFVLPETNNVPLKQTIQEGEEFIKESMCMAAPCKNSRCLKRPSANVFKIVTSGGDDDEELINSTAIDDNEDDGS